MGAQRVATGVGLLALVALLVAVGAPALLPPDPVPAIEVVVPVANPPITIVRGHAVHPVQLVDDQCDRLGPFGRIVAHQLRIGSPAWTWAPTTT